MSTTKNIEESTIFSPVYDGNGLIPCVTIDAKTKEILMLAYMNQEALNETLKTGVMHYWSRSRQTLWRKGATSGAIQNLEKIRTDCDQDALIAEITLENNHKSNESCHTGRKTCFYRALTHKNGDTTLKFED